MATYAGRLTNAQRKKTAQGGKFVKDLVQLTRQQGDVEVALLKFIKEYGPLWSGGIAYAD